MKVAKICLILFVAILLTPYSVYAQTDTTTGNRAEVDRVTTATIYPYLPYQAATQHLQEHYSGNMGSVFNYNIEAIFKGYIHNMVVNSNPEASCIYDADNLAVNCTGTITDVIMDFDFIKIATYYSNNYIYWGWGGSSSYAMDYTIILNFPSPLVYVGSHSGTPTSVTPSQIVWHGDDNYLLYGYALFSDPRVSFLYLPLILK